MVSSRLKKKKIIYIYSETYIKICKNLLIQLMQYCSPFFFLYLLWGKVALLFNLIECLKLLDNFIVTPIFTKYFIKFNKLLIINNKVMFATSLYKNQYIWKLL